MSDINDQKLAQYQLDGENASLLKKAGALLVPELDAVLKSFYERATADPESAAFFDTPARMDFARSAQKAHWERLLNAEFDADYFASVERIGRTHARIDLPVGVYMSAYSLASSDLISIFLHKSRGGFLSRNQADLGRQTGILVRAFSMDIERVVDTTFRVQAEKQNTAFRHINQVIGKMAMGDLTQLIPSPQDSDFPAEFDEVRFSMNTAIDRLGQTLAKASTTMGKLLLMIDGLGDSANSLSDRTASQAASLEETAAAIHELTENVAQSSDNTKRAKSVAGDAARTAEEGAHTVSEASEAMGRIQTTSDRITQIITMIDDIAFQTNLLALNAGVEAARAGKAGRGFAVVAEEVRVLAGNASEAARQIKDLVTTSSGEVASGVELIQRAADSLSDIVKNFDQVSDLSAEIASASAEQSTALSEVNSAISQMDHVTQQNASMVGDTTNAAQQMSTEALELQTVLAGLNVPAINEADQGSIDQNVPQARRA